MDEHNQVLRQATRAEMVSTSILCVWCMCVCVIGYRGLRLSIPPTSSMAHVYAHLCMHPFSPPLDSPHEHTSGGTGWRTAPPTSSPRTPSASQACIRPSSPHTPTQRESPLCVSTHPHGSTSTSTLPTHTHACAYMQGPVIRAEADDDQGLLPRVLRGGGRRGRAGATHESRRLD